MPRHDQQSYPWTRPEILKLIDQKCKSLIKRALSDGGLGGTPSDHGVLSGLVDDDHTQYLLDAGATGGDGITVATRSIAVDLATVSGLEFDAAALRIDIDPDVVNFSSISATGLNTRIVGGEGITADKSTGGISIDLATLSGLKFTAGTLHVFAGDGLAIAVTGDLVVDLTATPGLEFSGGQLQVKDSDGITKTASGIEVDLALATPGLEFVAGRLSVDAVAPIILTTSGVALSIATENLEIDAGALRVIGQADTAFGGTAAGEIAYRATVAAGTQELGGASDCWVDPAGTGMAVHVLPLFPLRYALEVGNILGGPVFSTGGLKVGQTVPVDDVTGENGAIRWNETALRIQGFRVGPGWQSFGDPYIDQDSISVTIASSAVYNTFFSHTIPGATFIAANDGIKVCIGGTILNNTAGADVLFIKLEANSGGGGFVTVWEDRISVPQDANERPWFFNLDYHSNPGANTQRLNGVIEISEDGMADVGRGNLTAPPFVSTAIEGNGTLVSFAAIIFRLQMHWTTSDANLVINKHFHTVELYG